MTIRGFSAYGLPYGKRRVDLRDLRRAERVALREALRDLREALRDLREFLGRIGEPPGGPLRDLREPLRLPPNREGPTEEDMLEEPELAAPELAGMLAELAGMLAELADMLAELAELPELRFLRVALLPLALEGPKKSKMPISIFWSDIFVRAHIFETV